MAPNLPPFCPEQRERSGWIGSKIDRGYPVRAIVERVRGADLPGSALGIVVRITMEGEEPELPVDADRGVRLRGHRDAA